jgi:hypothetical protein
MSALVALAIVIAGVAGAIVRALLIDQVRGQIQRHLTQSVESTIARLPDDLQTEWGEEWRAELAACIAMPLTAARFARGLRARAHTLIDAPEPAVPTNASSHRGRRWRPLLRVVGPRWTLRRGWLAGYERVLSRVDWGFAVAVAVVLVVVDAVVYVVVAETPTIMPPAGAVAVSNLVGAVALRLLGRGR